MLVRSPHTLFSQKNFIINKKIQKKILGLLTLFGTFLKANAGITYANYYFYEPNGISLYRYKIQEHSSCDFNLGQYINIFISNCSAIAAQIGDDDFTAGFTSYCASMCLVPPNRYGSSIALTIRSNDNSSLEFEGCVTGLLKTDFGETLSNCNPYEIPANVFYGILLGILAFILVCQTYLRCISRNNSEEVNPNDEAPLPAESVENAGDYSLLQNNIPDDEAENFSNRLLRSGYTGNIPENLTCPFSNTIINNPVTRGPERISYDRTNLQDFFQMPNLSTIECPRSHQLIPISILQQDTDRQVRHQLSQFVSDCESQMARHRRRNGLFESSNSSSTHSTDNNCTAALLNRT